MARSTSKTTLIYLTGMPSCGKSTLGRLLAQAINYDFVDLDHYIEKKNGLTIPEIFETKGEDFFRIQEKQAVIDSTSWDNTVVACGGGAPCFFDNMKTMNKYGKTIFINVSMQTLQNRLTRSHNKRPLLANKSHSELLSELKTKFIARQKFYTQAKSIFFYDNLQLEQLLQAI